MPLVTMEEDYQDNLLVFDELLYDPDPASADDSASCVFQDEPSNGLDILATIASREYHREGCTPSVEHFSPGGSGNHMLHASAMGFLNHNPNTFITTMAPSLREFSSTYLTSLSFDVPIFSTLTNPSSLTSAQVSVNFPIWYNELPDTSDDVDLVTLESDNEVNIP